MKKIFKEDFIKTTALEFVILGFASLKPFSGYDIKKIFDKSYIIRWSASPGSIYPALKRLEKKGLLQSEKVVDGKIPKEVYSLTKEGSAVLKDWTRLPFKGTEIVRYGLELKILFLNNLTTKERDDYVKQQIDAINDAIDYLPRWKSQMQIKNKFRDILYEEKLKEFKNYIKLLEQFINI